MTGRAVTRFTLFTVAAPLTALALAGCKSDHSALDPAGPGAAGIGVQTWLLLSLTTLVYIAVMAGLFMAVRRRAAGADDTVIVRPDPAYEKRMARVIVGFLAVSTVILFVFLIGDFVVGRKVFSTPPRDPVMIKVTGHQWWWEFQYEHVPGEEDAAQNIFTTANELHIPVGTPVFLKLDSVDVIHSFWVPNLNGKKDLIPGQPTSLWLQADRPGTYYGQCAEYCGAQHAHMRIVVTAEPDADFRKWLAASRQLSEPPPRPAAGAEPDSVRRGYEVFTSQRPSSCLVCHTIDGTAARGRVGPNLSHLASRTTIGAGALEFNRENLRRWISDPQKIKPGVNMPPNPLSDADMNALLDYLETQK